MREAWQRGAAPVALTPTQAGCLLRPVFGRCQVCSLTSLGGGLINTTLAINLATEAGERRVVLRLYQGASGAAAKEAAIARRLDGVVPGARWLYGAARNPITGGAYAVQEWVAGLRLDHAAMEADTPTLAALGAAVGATLARVHGVRFPSHGFFGTDLAIAQPIALDGAALLGFMRERLTDGPGGARLGSALTEALFAVAARHAGLLEAWPGGPRLIHGDCNPSNILLRQEAGGWMVAGVLDWEFALSGLPAMDFGMLLRPDLGARPGFATALEAGYRAAGGALPEDWRASAMLADVFAWADQLGKPAADPALIADARTALTATIAALS